MAKKSYLNIGKKQFQTAWYVRYELLLPFKPGDYDGNEKFSTSVKKAKENLAAYGITLANMEQKVANIIRIDVILLRKFRETGEDELFHPEDDSDSIMMRLDIFKKDDHPALGQMYDILQALEQCNDSKEITLDLKEIHKMYDPEEWYHDADQIFEEAEENYLESLITINLLEDFKNVDVFINHDSSDKEDFVDELASKLRSKGLNVWYDEFELQVGDDIEQKIQKGLQDCRYGIVVLSNNFMKNFGWAQEEFKSLKAKERHYNKRLILPIWRNDITEKQISEYNLELAERFALKENEGIDEIVDKITYRISIDK